MAWTVQQTNTDAQSATTDDTPLEVASITFTPTAGHYLIIASCEVNDDDDFNGQFIDLVTNDAVIVAEQMILQQELTNWEPSVLMYEAYLPNASIKFSLYIESLSGIANLSARHRRIVILRLDDQSSFAPTTDQHRNKLGDHTEANSDGSSASTSTSYTAKTTLTFTPPAAGYYLVMASAEFQVDTASLGGSVKLDYDTDTLLAETVLIPQEATNWEPIFLMLQPIYLTAASHTFRVSFLSNTAGFNVDIRDARIVAIPLTGTASIEALGNTAGLIDLEGLGRSTTAGQIDAVSFFTFSTAAGTIDLIGLAKMTTAGQIVLEAIPKSTTAGRLDLATRTAKVTGLSPCGTSEALPIVFVWTIPANVDNKAVNFHFQYADDSGFSTNLVEKKSQIDSGFEFWDGDSWEPVPVTGVTSTYYGNQARISLSPSAGLKYWRVRGGHAA